MLLDGYGIVGGAGLGVFAIRFGALGGGSGGNSVASTPYGHPGGRSGLGNTGFVEEDEALEIEREV